MKLLLTTGPGLEAKRYGHILVVDWESKEILDSIQVRHLVYSESHKGFSGGFLISGKLAVTNEVELFEFQLKPLKMIQRISYDFLNDVHHICYHNDLYYVCNSGLDTLEVFDKKFKHLKTIFLYDLLDFDFDHLFTLFKDEIRRFLDRKIGRYTFYGHLMRRYPFRNVIKILYPKYFHKSHLDLRQIDFRPHLLHPNHCFSVNGDLWITLWRPGVVLNIDKQKIMVNGLGRPHDGIIYDDEFFITDCFENRLLSFEFHNKTSSIGKNKINKVVTNQKKEGFLRGCTVNGNSVFAALSARRGAADWNFARILELDRRTAAQISEWKLPEQYGKLIYSVIDVSHIY